MKTSILNKNANHPLQTYEWGEFRKKTGNQIYRTDKYQLTIHPLPFFKNLKVGTLIKGPKPTEKQIQELKSIAKEQNLIFIKTEPNVVRNDQDIKLLKKHFVAGKTLFTPTTFWIDLTQKEETLLKNFHSKTRYNIRLAQKHGVVIKENNSDEAFAKYLELTEETSKRQGFYAHSKKYHTLMWQSLHKDMIKNKQKPIARLLTAVYKNEIITTWILFVWKDFLYFPYGASTDKYKNVMAPNLMMWEAIKFGQKLNCKVFDLWGREIGKGFTKFKEGYSPKVVEFLGTWDLVVNPFFYYCYKIADIMRWSFLRIKSKFISPNF